MPRTTGTSSRHGGPHGVQQLQRSFIERCDASPVVPATTSARTPALGEVLGVAGGGGGVDVAVLVEERDEGDGDAGEHGRGAGHAVMRYLLGGRGSAMDAMRASGLGPRA